MLKVKTEQLWPTSLVAVEMDEGFVTNYKTLEKVCFGNVILR